MDGASVSAESLALSRDERRFLDEFVGTVSTEDWRPRSIEFRVVSPEKAERLAADGFEAVAASSYSEGLGVSVLVARDEREAKRIEATADWFRNGGE